MLQTKVVWYKGGHMIPMWIMWMLSFFKNF